MKTFFNLLFLVLLILIYALLSNSLFTVGEAEQVIITRFGKPEPKAITDAGLHWKMPIAEVVNRFDKRILEWDGPATKMPTRDKVYIVVDSFARWRITNASVFFVNVRDERSALSRLSDILASETRNVIAKHDFIEAIRTSKGRKVTTDEQAVEKGGIADARLGTLPEIRKGRTELEKEIFANASPKVTNYGIELMDVRLKRINYTPEVNQTIYQRMISERTQIAERFESEGQGEAAKILGQRERELKQIESSAYRRVQEIEGAADAKATEIYARAYNQTGNAQELFSFMKSLELYKKALGSETKLILSTQSEFLRYLKSSEPQQQLPASGRPLSGVDSLPSLMELAQPKSSH
jgi:modulator of FtsH protease HflC